MAEQRVIPYAAVDETVSATARAVLYKILQTPGRLFWAGIMAGILIGIGFWLAFTCAAAFAVKKVVAFDAARDVLVLEKFTEDIRQLAICKTILGAVFPLGLIAILIGGAELWTSCPQLPIYPLLTGKVGYRGIIYNWVASYSGNFVGGFILAFMATYGTSLLVGSPFFDLSTVVAFKKAHLDAWTAFWRGIGCNFLVNLAVWLWLRSKKSDFAGQAILIWFPIFAFVAIGYEHCIANMFAIPVGIFNPSIKWGTYVITYREFFFNNLLPVTYGNLVGAVLFITVYYWYLAAVKGSKLGIEAGPVELLAAIIKTCVILAAVHLVLMVLIPGGIAVAVEQALGLAPGVKLATPYLALVPGIAAAIYYIIMPFIVYKALKPWTDVKP